jgi:hypothetical protein
MVDQYHRITACICAYVHVCVYVTPPSSVRIIIGEVIIIVRFVELKVF